MMAQYMPKTLRNYKNMASFKDFLKQEGIYKPQPGSLAEGMENNFTQPTSPATNLNTSPTIQPTSPVTQGTENWLRPGETEQQWRERVQGPSLVPKIDTTSAITSDEERRRIAAEEAEIKKKEDEELIASDKELAKLQRESAIKELKESLGISSDRPVLTSYASDYEALRSENGVAAVETQLNNVNKEIAEMEAALRQGVKRIGDKLAPMELIGTRQKELQEQGREEIDSLYRRKQVLVDEYNTKQGIIADIMKWKDIDYTNAVNDYNSKFSEAVQINSLLDSKEDKEKAEENMIRDDARANLSVILDTAMKAGQTFNEMPPEMQALARSLELKAGYPIGMIDYMMSIKTNPLNEIVSHGKSNDTAGNEFVYMIERDPSTGEMNMTKIYTGGAKSSSSGSEKDKSKNLEMILSGFATLKELTPTERLKVKSEAYELGLYSNTVPNWFKEMAEEKILSEYHTPMLGDKNHSLQPSLMGSKVQELWDQYRKPIIDLEEVEEGEESIDDLIDKYLK